MIQPKRDLYKRVLSINRISEENLHCRITINTPLLGQPTLTEINPETEVVVSREMLEEAWERAKTAAFDDGYYVRADHLAVQLGLKAEVEK